MNKLQGFYELKWIGIPSVPWNIFTAETELNDNLLWSIRVAVEYGEDINLPRAIGVNAEQAKQKANDFLSIIQNNGFVIYYPYFIALKSGNIEIKQNHIVIEAVAKDLWNLTTKGRRDITLIVSKNTKEISFNGKKDFLTTKEINELLKHAARVRVKYKDYIFDRSSVLVEWSYAVNTDINHKPVGQPYLVFYECRVLDFNNTTK